MSPVGRDGGGVEVGGGIRAGAPSAPGTWASSYDPQAVEFDRDAFTRALAAHGDAVCWEKAVLCPNVPGTGLSPRDHVAACPICGGFGFVYVDPVSTRMLMQGISITQSFYAYGQWTTGTQMVTAEPEFTISHWDRLTLLDGVERFTERRVRQPGTALDVLKYAPLCVEYAGWVDRSGILVKFRGGDDFQTSSDGSSIQWIGAQPDAGSVFTVSYEYRPRYVVVDLPHARRDGTVEGRRRKFPVQAVARLDYLIRNQGADPQQVVDGDPFPR